MEVSLFALIMFLSVFSIFYNPNMRMLLGDSFLMKIEYLGVMKNKKRSLLMLIVKKSSLVDENSKWRRRYVFDSD